MKEPQKTEWLELMKRVSDLRAPLYFRRRKMFDDALRPKLDSGNVMAYPDAIYHIKKEDVDRAGEIVNAEIK